MTDGARDSRDTVAPGAAVATSTPDSTASPIAGLSALSALSALTRRLNERPSPLAEAMRIGAPADAGAPVARYPEMAVLPFFRQTWSTLRLDGQMRRSLQYVPENAGPLNSRSLVHRALSLMQQTAPGYLQHLLAHIDAIGAVGQAIGQGTNGTAPSGAGAPQAAGGTAPSMPAPRKTASKRGAASAGKAAANAAPRSATKPAAASATSTKRSRS